MKAVIMAGGEGKRLRQLFPGIPKALVKINTVPVLEHQINNLSDCGIKDIVVAIGYRGDLIKEYFGTGSAWGVHIDYFCEPHPLGTAGALYYLQDCLSQDFLLLYGDLVLNLDFNRLISFHYRKKASATLVAHPNSHPYDSDLLTVDEDDRVISILGKDAPRPCCYRNLVNAGVFVLQRAILRHLAAGDKLDVEKNLLKPILGKEKIYAYRTPNTFMTWGPRSANRLVEQHIRSGIVAAKNLSASRRPYPGRDGTVNDYAGLISKPEELRVDNEVYRALREITRSEYISIIITNQPVVARNNCSLNDLHYIHACLETMLGRQQVYVDDILFCPHHPDQGYPEENKAFKIDCECRKPKTGLIDLAVKKYNIDLQQSYFIGDSTVDIKTGHNAV
jgi:D,D-heptose 1,7-bisphosphate phosphatase